MSTSRLRTLDAAWLRMDRPAHPMAITSLLTFADPVTFDEVRALVDSRLLRIRRFREACPPGLEAVLMRCLAKRPADRWQNAEELVHALEPFAVSSGGTTPAQTRPTTATTTTC